MAKTRVVVHLTENVGSDQANADDTLQYGGELSILDNKTLRLLCCQNASNPQVLVAEKLRFDLLCANNNEEFKDRELNTLLLNLFVDQRDCLLMYLTAQRGYHLMFLVDALVIQINVKLQQLGLQLEEGAVSYRQLLDGDCLNTLDTQCKFSDTKNLMDWLLNEYRVRTALATGPEALQVEYSVVQNNLDIRFSVHFHILLVSMEEFCRGTLCSFRCYLSNDPITAALSVTELTTYLRQAAELDSSKPLYTLMYFHVLATDGKVNGNTVQLLGLAHLACKQGDAGQDRVETNQVLQAVSKRISDSQIQLEEFERSVQDVNNSFKLVHDCMVEYLRQEQQLKDMRELLDVQCSNFMPILLDSKAKLLQLINLMMRRT